MADITDIATQTDTIPVFAMRRTTSPLTEAVHAAAAKLLTLQMTHISGDADEHDARNLMDDLEALIAIIDPIVEAVGNYAASNFNGIDRSLFKDQLRGALEGQATFELEQAGEKVVEDRQLEAAE